MQPLWKGSSVGYSGVSWNELCKLSEERTLGDLDWAFEADYSDTDLEPDDDEGPKDDEQDGADSAVANPQDVSDAEPDPEPPWRSGSSCGGSRKVRLSGSSCGRSRKLYARRGEMQVFHMGDIRWASDIHEHTTAAEIRQGIGILPCRFGMRDVHMATYVLGAKADPNDLVHALRKTGMPIIVLVFTEVVSDCHDILTHLNRWATIARDFNGRRPPPGSDAEEQLRILEDKRIVSVGMRGDIFVCLHRDRVITATFEERVLTCPQQDFDEDIQFGTLTVHFGDEGGLDPGDYVRIGIVVTRRRLTDVQVTALAQWIILHRLAVLTGFFACSHDHRYNDTLVRLPCDDSVPASPCHDFNRDSPLMDLARKTRAVGCEPLFQQVDLSPSSDERQVWAIPVPWMFFGYARAIKQPNCIARAVLDSDDGMDFGGDLNHELMRQDYIPNWPPNAHGHAYVPYLDVIRVTPIDWSIWIDGCFMTAVRFGRSTTPRGNRKHPRMLDPEHVEVKRKRHRCHANSEEDEQN